MSEKMEREVCKSYFGSVVCSELLMQKEQIYFLSNRGSVMKQHWAPRTNFTLCGARGLCTLEKSSVCFFFVAKFLIRKTKKTLSSQNPNPTFDSAVNNPFRDVLDKIRRYQQPLQSTKSKIFYIGTKGQRL